MGFLLVLHPTFKKYQRQIVNWQFSECFTGTNWRTLVWFVHMPTHTHTHTHTQQWSVCLGACWNRSGFHAEAGALSLSVYLCSPGVYLLSLRCSLPRQITARLLLGSLLREPRGQTSLTVVTSLWVWGVRDDWVEDSAHGSAALAGVFVHVWLEDKRMCAGLWRQSDWGPPLTWRLGRQQLGSEPCLCVSLWKMSGYLYRGR